MRNERLIECILRIFLGGFFVWSGGKKVMDLGAFVESVGNFQLEMETRMPGAMEGWFEAPADAVIAYGVPWFEVFAGLAVLTGLGKSGGLAILFGMLVSFNLALWSAWNRGITDLVCGCHGPSETPTDFGFKIVTNFGLMVLVVVIALWPLVRRRVR